MKFHIFIVLAIISFAAVFTPVSAQVDSAIGQITSSPNESFAGGISGDGRLVVFESNGDLATENPRNADGNREIFIFDYAQRRIFQITNTKSLLTDTTKAATFDNTRVEILSIRPVMSNDGRYIAFGSNATIAFPGVTGGAPPIVSTTNPGNFDANTFTVRDTSGAFVSNSLTNDGNTEMWLYQIPAVASVNLSNGGEIAVTDLSAGTFTRVTNTVPSRLPVAGTASSGPVIADDNREATINNNGNYIAFVSTRDLVSGGNASPNNNDEIFSYFRSGATISQVTQTARGTISAPIYNGNPSISGNGLRVSFLSNGDNSIVGMTGGTNSDGNVEIFYTDLNAAGAPSANRTQVTRTTRTTAGQIINIFDLGRRMSLDGRYIAFESYADLAVSQTTNMSSFALYLYDTTTAAFRQIGPRSDADASANGGDVEHYPGFTDTDANGTPSTLVFETRLNIKADGTIPTTAADGLNPEANRPPQLYSYPLNLPATTAAFTRLTTFPPPTFLLGSTQAIPSNSLRRMTFTLALTEIGTGNSDLANEAFYFLLPVVTTTPATSTLAYFTGASRLSISATPTPTPTATPTPTPTPTPSPSPTPVTPSSVLGVSPGLLAIVDYTPGTPVVSQTAVGSLSRRFTLPIELSGVTVTINGAAAGIKSVSAGEVFFVVPPGLPAAAAGTVYPIVINNNGTTIKGSLTVVPARPDIFTTSAVPIPNGRARIFNATNRVQTTEPFTVTTIKIKGGVRVPTVFRVFLTGVENVPASVLTIRAGAQIAVPVTGAVLREPGVYSIDFTLPAAANGTGDVPLIITITVNGVTLQSRLDDTAPRFRIL